MNAYLRWLEITHEPRHQDSDRTEQLGRLLYSFDIPDGVQVMPVDLELDEEGPYTLKTFTTDPSTGDPCLFRAVVDIDSFPRVRAAAPSEPAALEGDELFFVTFHDLP